MLAARQEAASIRTLPESGCSWTALLTHLKVSRQYRNTLRRTIVTPGDTEPAGVGQQRHLGLTAPSPYDLRNLFQVKVEEGRHLWAMVCLLHRYFGRDGREEGWPRAASTHWRAPASSC